MTSINQKLKLLYLARIFETQTDDEHGLTTPELIAELSEHGVTVERKTLYNDIECLIAFGYDIQKYQRNPVEYGLASRAFQEQELLLLADAVQSSKFLTTRKSNDLVSSIALLGSEHMEKSLKKNVHVEGRIHSQNESVFYNIDAIQRAINEKKKVEFKYYKYNEKKEQELQHNGKTYCETPVQLIYMEDSYYLVTWNDKHEDFTNYRVDRMLRLRVSKELATRNSPIAQFNVGEYQQRVFGMFNGEAVPVTLIVQASAMSAVIDKFGTNIETTPAGDGAAKVYVTVMKSPTFYGWLAQFGNTIVIDAPTDIKKAYVDYLESVVSHYK